ncbi:Thiol-disulfide oxidoreductase ResA [compost metagenome]
MLKGLGPKAQKSKLAAAMLRAQAPKMTSALVNQQAPDFTLTDAQGKPVKLSDFKGKYVLLDFWASWCAPCRREMPFLKAAYEKYNAQNFTILSVSMDTETEKWRKALDDEKMPWTQLLDDSKQQTSTLYSVQFIPTNFLIDPAGKVIAFGLYGEDVSKQLGSMLKN